MDDKAVWIEAEEKVETFCQNFVLIMPVEEKKKKDNIEYTII